MPDSFATPRIVAHQPLGSPVHGFSRQEYWEWVAISFSRGSSQPRDRTCVSCAVVSCIVSGFFTDWATRDALYTSIKKIIIAEKIINSNWYSQFQSNTRVLLICFWWGFFFVFVITSSYSKIPNPCYSQYFFFFLYIARLELPLLHPLPALQGRYSRYFFSSCI